MGRSGWPISNSVIEGAPAKKGRQMAKDLRAFLDRLKRYYPQGLITVREGRGRLDPNECECTALLHQLARMNKRPTVLFENVSTPSGERWPGQVIFSEMSGWPNAAVIVDLDPQGATVAEIIQTLHNRGKNPKPWTVVKKQESPVKEVIWEGQKADNLLLPSYRKDSGDARIGWLSGIAVAKDLNTGRYNCSWHRHLVHSSKKTTARVNPRHLQELMDRYKAAGYEEMPVACIYGHHPAFLLAAGMQPGWDVDEYEFAGGLLGESLRLVPSETLGEDFLVPADAEVVVEGFLHLTEKDANGPWTDILLYYSPQTLEPIFRPSVITMRRDPFFSENWTGYDLMPSLVSLTQMHLALSERFPRVKAVNYVAPYTFVIQFRPKVAGEVNRLAAFALGAFGDMLKNVIIVDEDIDPFDLPMVFYSIATRVNPATDQIQIIKHMRANANDPSSERDITVGGMIIDSTKPVDRSFPEIGFPPGEVFERLKIQDFLSSEEIAGIPSEKR
jgi:2,5-furandicarboxylate decarboxylase 1